MSESENPSPEDSCSDCKKITSRFKIHCQEPNAFIVHIDVTLLSGSKSKQETKQKVTKEEKKEEEKKARAELKKQKKNRLDKLSKVASALRNSDGGAILVHLSGYQDGEKYLGYFDEFVSDSLNYLIEDGRLYVDTYKRFWLHSLKEFRLEKCFVCINVCKTSGVSISDFNTKIRNDFENVKPTPLNIFRRISDSAPLGKISSPIVRGIKPDKLQESRNIELKSISRNGLQTKSTPVIEFVDYVWLQLKLRDNITSMSKIFEGGSFYVGVAEEKVDKGTYYSKTPFLEGFELYAHPSKYVREIQKRLATDISVLDRNLTLTKAPEDLTKVTFHPHGYKKWILEVSVRQFDGTVFYDKQGPRAYVVAGNNIHRLESTELIKKFQLKFQHCALNVLRQQLQSSNEEEGSIVYMRSNRDI